MIKITAVEGDVVHFEGTVTLVELDGTNEHHRARSR